MNRMLPLVLVSVCLSGASPIAGQIEVSILNAPPSVFSFEPIWVTYEVRNEGNPPLLVPGDGCNGQGAILEVGWQGEPLGGNLPTSTHCRPNRHYWLPSGGRRLFFQQVFPGAGGTFEIEAVLRSTGRCIGSVVGGDPAETEAMLVNDDGVWPYSYYQCWEGEARSDRVSVDVAVPATDADLAAARALNLDDVKSMQNVLMLRLSELTARFPTSHYTYAAYGASWRGRATGMMTPILLQPENPLNPWAAGAIAVRLAYANRPCATRDLSDDEADIEFAARVERVLAAHPPPGPVMDYVRQIELEFAAEDCPGETGEGQPQQ